MMFLDYLDYLAQCWKAFLEGGKRIGVDLLPYEEWLDFNAVGWTSYGPNAE